MYKTLILSLLLIPSVSLAYFDQNLYFGMKGNTDVQMLQEFLSEQGFFSGTATGNFFSLTLKGVKDFQNAKGISPTSGYFGPLTRAQANNVLASQGVFEGVTDEAGITINPPVTTPKTIDDATAKLNEQIELLKKQVAEAEKTNASLADIQAKQALQDQKLGAIQANTTKPVVVEPTPVVREVVKDLVVTTDKNSVRLNGWETAQIRAIYTEDGISRPGEISFAVDNVTKTVGAVEQYCTGFGGEKCKVATFTYRPSNTETTHTITVTVNGVSKTIDIQAVQNVTISPVIRDVTNRSPIVERNKTVALGSFRISDADEPICIDKIESDSDLPNTSAISISLGGDHVPLQSTLPCIQNSYDNSEMSYFIIVKDTGNNLGGHYVRIKSIRLLGVGSGQYRYVTGTFPVDFTFTVSN